MSFNEIDPFRKALAGISGKTINPSMRDLLWVIISYADGCFIGHEELEAQAGLTPANLKKVRNKCLKLGLLLRDQKHARQGLQQLYRVNIPRLQELARVEDSNPSQLTYRENILERVEINPSEGRTISPEGVKVVTPYREQRKERYKKSPESELFESFIQLFPTEQRFPQDRELLDLLLKLEHKGTPLKAVEADLSDTNWRVIRSPREFAKSLLKQLLARAPYYTQENPPPKCEPLCRRDEVNPTRFPNVDGGTSPVCQKCDPFYVNKSNGYKSSKTARDIREKPCRNDEVESLIRKSGFGSLPA